MTPWTVACKVLLSMQFSIQEYCSGKPFPSQGDLPDPGIEMGSPALQEDSLPSEFNHNSGKRAGVPSRGGSTRPWPKSLVWDWLLRPPFCPDCPVSAIPWEWPPLPSGKVLILLGKSQKSSLPLFDLLSFGLPPGLQRKDKDHPGHKSTS